MARANPDETQPRDSRGLDNGVQEWGGEQMGKFRLLANVRIAAGVAIAALALSLAHPPAAQAETPSEFISTLGDTAIGMLVDDALSDAERIDLFRGLMIERFDLPLMSRYVLGVHWRRASSAQRDEYSVLFEAFIVKIYSSRLGNYGGQTLRIKTARTAGKDTVVSSEIRGPDAPAVRVDWRVRGDAGNYKVVDIIIEGASMVITQRDEFSSVIRRSGGKLEGLLARLRATTSPDRGQQVSQADLELAKHSPESLWEK